MSAACPRRTAASRARVPSDQFVSPKAPGAAETQSDHAIDRLEYRSACAAPILALLAANSRSTKRRPKAARNLDPWSYDS